MLTVLIACTVNDRADPPPFDGSLGFDSADAWCFALNLAGTGEPGVACVQSETGCRWLRDVANGAGAAAFNHVGECEANE